MLIDKDAEVNLETALVVSVMQFTPLSINIVFFDYVFKISFS